MLATEFLRLSYTHEVFRAVDHPLVIRLIFASAVIALIPTILTGLMTLGLLIGLRLEENFYSFGADPSTTLSPALAAAQIVVQEAAAELAAAETADQLSAAQETAQAPKTSLS